MENESVEWLDIVFRSPDHLIWFKMSLILFAGGFIAFLINFWKPRSSWHKLPGSLAFFHLTASFLAIIHTQGGTINGPVYSVDCIWFNALMGAIHTVLFLVAKKIATINVS